MLWKHISYILGSPLSRKILVCLSESEKPIAPLQIAKKTNIARSNVSTKLGHLSKRGLVRCINPEVRKWRFYVITKDGEAVLREIKKMGR